MKGKYGDIVKTVAAVIVIGGVIVATFLYGNRQRQAQLQRDQQIREQQTASQQSAQASVSPQTPAPAAAAPAAATPTTGGSGTTPRTGGELGYLLPATAMVLVYQATRRSRLALQRAALNA